MFSFVGGGQNFLILLCTCEEDRRNPQADGCHPESDALLYGTKGNFWELVHHGLSQAIQHKYPWTAFYDYIYPGIQF